MSVEKRVKLAVVVVCALGSALLWTWLMAASGPEAQGTPLAPLAFISPIGNPQFGLRKVVDNDHPAPGNPINYTLFYRNLNTGSQAFNVRLYDVLPPGAQVLSTQPPATQVQNGVLLFTAPSVGPATNEMSVTVRVRVPDGLPQLVNNALVMADGVSPVFTSLLTSVALQPSSDLRLTKLGNAFALTNTQIVYTLQCANVGDTAAYEVTVVDVMPNGLPLVGASPAPDPMALPLPLLRWSLGTLGAGEVRTIVITTTSPAFTGIITNSAVMGSLQNVMTQTLFATRVVGSGPILQVTKGASPTPADAGRTLVYTLRYQNTGNLPATGVILTDTLPSDLTVVSTYPPAAQGGQKLTWNLGTLAPTGQGQVVITTTVGPAWGKVLHNVVDITGQAGAYPGHAELDTSVRLLKTYLPIVMKNSR
jgi:uncharacterized repeat protein (TIGR01451 family)